MLLSRLKSRVSATKYNEKPNLIGQRFGRLLVIGAAPSDKNGRSMWLTRCDCGTESVKKESIYLMEIQFRVVADSAK